MSSAIQFLESMGGNSAMARMSTIDYATAIAALNVDGEQQQALLDRDQTVLNDLLGGRLKMLFAIMPADDESGEELPEREQPVRETPEPEERPSE